VQLAGEFDMKTYSLEMTVRDDQRIGFLMLVQRSMH
jgi:hypothetical protein